MAIDYTKLQADIQAAIAKVIGKDWSTIRNGAYPQVMALLETARMIESDSDQMKPTELQSLKLSQQRAMEGVLTSYAAISLVVAQQAAAAAWSVIETASKTAAGI